MVYILLLIGMLWVHSPVFAQEEQFIRIPLVVAKTFGAKGELSPACLSIKSRMYDLGWDVFVQKATTGPEKALVATITAMKTKDVEGLKAASHPDFLANPKQFDMQAQAFFSQLQMFEMESISSTFSYDDIVIFWMKIGYKGKSDFVRFVFRQDTIGNKYGFLADVSSKNLNEVPSIIVRDWFMSPWGPRNLATPSYCPAHEFNYQTVLGGQSENGAKISLVGAPADDTKNPIAQEAVTALTRMQVGLTAGQVEDYFNGYTEKDKKDYKDWYLKEPELSRKQHEEYFTAMKPVFVFNVDPFVILYAKRPGFAIDPFHVFYFVRDDAGQLKLKGLSMGSTLDRIFKSKEFLQAAEESVPFKKFKIDAVVSQ